MRPPLLLLPCLFLLAVRAAAVELAGHRPNVVLIFLDDAGYGDFGFTGHPTIATPNLDSMAREGRDFRQWSVPSPACSASRYSLLTGRNPGRSGFPGWVLGPESREFLAGEEITLAEMLAENGYATAMIGKWHLGYPNEANGFDPASLPLAHGFDYFLGIGYSNDMIPEGYPDLLLLEGGTRPPLLADGPLARDWPRAWRGTGQAFGETGYRILARNPDQDGLITRSVDAGLAFIGEVRRPAQPFFLYLALTQPHVPLHPGEAYRGASRRGLYGDVIEEIDAQVGRLREELARLDLTEDTLIIFTSDNGPWLSKGLVGGSAGPFRDGKGSTWEGGVREPGLWCWPGTIPPGTSAEVTSTLDVLPTLAALAGEELPGSLVHDGVDISTLLADPATTLPERTLFFSGGDNRPRALRRGPWKLHWRTGSQLDTDHGFGAVSPERPLLFNVEQDPGETRNVADRNAELVRELLRERRERR